MDAVGTGLAAVVLLAVAQLAEAGAVVLAGDPTPRRVRAPGQWVDVLGQVVVPLLLAVAGLPPVGWTPRVPRHPRPASRRAALAAGLASLAVPLACAVLLPPLRPVALVVTGLLALPVPGQPGGRLLGAALPGAHRVRWRRWERTLPRPVAALLVLVPLLAAAGLRGR